MKARGKAGLIQEANSLEEARNITAKLLDKENVAGVLSEEKINCQEEIFLAIILDRQEGIPVLMYSPQVQGCRGQLIYKASSFFKWRSLALWGLDPAFFIKKVP